MSAELIRRCRQAIAASDETAKEAVPGPWVMRYDRGRGSHEVRSRRNTSLLGLVALDLEAQDAAHIAANDPATRMALNAALTVVLDSIAATLNRPHVQGSHWPDVHCDRATASLAAIAAALGVQPEPS